MFQSERFNEKILFFGTLNAIWNAFKRSNVPCGTLQEYMFLQCLLLVEKNPLYFRYAKSKKLFVLIRVNKIKILNVSILYNVILLIVTCQHVQKLV